MRMAICECGAPLICTFAFSGFEFYCLEDGRQYGWFGPNAAQPTPELNARYEALLAEWNEIAGAKLIGGGVMLKDCDTCRTLGEPHWNHATDEERAAHERALEALEERVNR